jgi:hypothetical protein
VPLQRWRAYLVDLTWIALCCRVCAIRHARFGHESSPHSTKFLWQVLPRVHACDGCAGEERRRCNPGLLIVQQGSSSSQQRTVRDALRLAVCLGFICLRSATSPPPARWSLPTAAAFITHPAGNDGSFLEALPTGWASLEWARVS